MVGLSVGRSFGQQKVFFELLGLLGAVLRPCSSSLLCNLYSLTNGFSGNDVARPVSVVGINRVRIDEHGNGPGRQKSPRKTVRTNRTTWDRREGGREEGREIEIEREREREAER